MPREDVMRAARAAVWARAIGVWNGMLPRGRREEMLREIAKFLVHLRAGAVEVQGNLQRGKVRPWNCVLDIAHPDINMRCSGLTLRPYGEVSAPAVEDAAKELRSVARAAGAVVWSDRLNTRPAPPGYVRTAREVVAIARTKLGDLDLGRALRVKSPEASVAAALAAIEAGNWVAMVNGYPSPTRDSLWRSSTDIEIRHKWVMVHLFLRDYDEREVYVRIRAARAPRALRPTFAAAYAKWYGRLAGALLVRRLEEVGA
jgi:hypothetical protein